MPVESDTFSPPAVTPEILPPPKAGDQTRRQPPSPQPPNQFIEMLKLLGPDILRGFRDFLKWDREKNLQEAAARRRHSFAVLVLLMAFLSLLLLGVGLLTYWGKVSSDALLFVVGAVSGWVMFTVQRHLFGTEPGEDEGILSGIL